MDIKWTEEQQKVISLRDRNILVSAAAGSGKTAVLVERILGMITDEKHPVDIDQLLIMTFTRAAAGEMRERIRLALEKALYDNPDNEHLQKQMTLIHAAQITTIDGFCSYVIRNYFHLIGLDPGFRVGDEGELKLLRQDVLDRLLEEYYGKNDPEFDYFVECYASGKSDEGIKDLILKMYESAMSNPFPGEWLEGCVAAYDEKTLREGTLPWMELLWKDVSAQITEAKAVVLEAERICGELRGPYLYLDALQEDQKQLEELEAAAQSGEFEKVQSILMKPVFVRLSGKRMTDVEERLREQVKALREEEKGILKDLGERYFQNTWEENCRIMAFCRRPLNVLKDLTRAFMEEFARQKQEKNILDFTDMEHFALKILLRKEGDTIVMSEAARELSEKYEEVLVDEYQDSNLVQEYLTNAVSGWSKNRNNVFMVGDVKQSIYRFRLARPELFMEKYQTYSLEDGPCQRVDLHRNFRSRGQVLEGVNYLFRQIMGEDLGGIAYDDAAALYPGCTFPQGGRDKFSDTEVLLLEKNMEGLEEEKELQNAREVEALTVAQKIGQIVGNEQIVDRQTGEYRPVRYGDIAVLLRTASGWAQTFSEVFASRGIPAYTATKTGYFSAQEVVTVLNYLQICDNPMQDIPLAGVLRSPIVGCTSQEMALLCSEYRDGTLYEKVCCCVGDGQLELFVSGEMQQLKEKLTVFLELLNEVRDMAAYTPVHQLILKILDKTGYGLYAKAMPGGAQRSANLTMLVERAMDYEKTSYRGLFNFVRYMEQLKKYEVDYGEVNISESESAAVQIMTIHKSKGLEFPVVIVAGMGKMFNLQDTNARLLIHPELGVGVDAVIPEQRILVPSLYRQIIREELLRESRGEELRILYVALTRAKEKLIITGTVGDQEKLADFLTRFRGRSSWLLPYGARRKGKNCLEYILAALAEHPAMDWLFEKYGIFRRASKERYLEAVPFQIHMVQLEELLGTEVADAVDLEIQRQLLENWDETQIRDEKIHAEIERRFSYAYPWDYRREIPAKVSVSELKKRSFHDDSEREETIFFEPDVMPLIPRFMEEKEESFTGAARGTAYHRVMECLDYGKVRDKKMVEEQIAGMVLENKMTAAEADCVASEDIWAFLKSPVGIRLTEAAGKRMLYREQPFVFSLSARELNENWSSGEAVLIQGIIDAYFAEGENLILVDYKTDRVSEGKRLVELYHVQLEDYAKALERLTGRRVTEKYIYSFTLKECIKL